MKRYGMAAGGPWDGSNLEGEGDFIRIPILRAGKFMDSPPATVKTVGGIQSAVYHWHGPLRMWIWEGPDVPVRG